MPRVTFYPTGKCGEVPSGISLLDAAGKLGFELRHDCGGFATCSTCRVWVREGMDHLSEIDLDEENMLEEAQLPPPYRLSCQAKISGDVVVQVDGEEMDWSKSALEELSRLPEAFRKTVRMIVEKKARREGIAVILPDTAIPYVAEAKGEIEKVAHDRLLFEAFVKQVHESP